MTWFVYTAGRSVRSSRHEKPRRRGRGSTSAARLMELAADLRPVDGHDAIEQDYLRTFN